MNVASLEVSRELYLLSGWHDDVERWWTFDAHGEWHAVRPKRFYEGRVPAYDLGYLVRKLPVGARVFRTQAGQWGVVKNSNAHAIWGDSPEDAACKLAIATLSREVMSVSAAV